ncbi:hypothetical protein VIGAN_02056800 [Vigna angularis var. angularis]|uniref:Uncharacterized protein n=1 Tax=Vigna angularis var. angularis TaxID=157739 RepID=A0A0S3RC40_PHAAN|nr:hypothetical protein VIGAN_02056800 [Vigna angularis var. angularis]
MRAPLHHKHHQGTATLADTTAYSRNLVTPLLLKSLRLTFTSPSMAPSLSQVRESQHHDTYDGSPSSLARVSISVAVVRSTRESAIPIFTDTDNGYGNTISVERTVKGFISAALAFACANP